MYGCEIRALTLMEGHRLRLFENRVLKRISGRRTEEVPGGWSKLKNEDLHKL
jgi:hypothetical protein